MLPKKLRIGKEEIKILKARHSDYKLAGELFVVKCFKSSELLFPKMAVVISKKNITKASHRNLIKRRLKQLFYLNRNTFPKWYFIFIITSELKISFFNYEKISSDFNIVLSKILKFR